jgi:hypothetical protein
MASDWVRKERYSPERAAWVAARVAEMEAELYLEWSEGRRETKLRMGRPERRRIAQAEWALMCRMRRRAERENRKRERRQAWLGRLGIQPKVS